MSLWLTIAEADAYFATRLGAADYWTPTLDKTAALTTAQSFLERSGRFTFPVEADDPDGYAAAAEPKRVAVCEQALFLLRDPAGVEARMALQAQGVLSAGIVQETYTGAQTLPIAPMAAAVLQAYASGSGNAFPIER